MKVKANLLARFYQKENVRTKGELEGKCNPGRGEDMPDIPDNKLVCNKKPETDERQKPATLLRPVE